MVPGMTVPKARPVPRRQSSIRQKDYAKLMQEDYAKLMQEDYAKLMQEYHAKIMQENYAKFMHEDYASLCKKSMQDSARIMLTQYQLLNHCCRR
jgi:hypothetical protein